MNIPQNLQYTKDHEWIKEVDGVYVVGITEFAQKELGDIVYVEVDTEGETLEQEEEFGSIEAVKTVSDLYMPISGEILELNEDLEDAPELVNEDPYGKGWIVKIDASDISELDNLLSPAEYESLIS